MVESYTTLSSFLKSKKITYDKQQFDQTSHLTHIFLKRVTPQINVHFRIEHNLIKLFIRDICIPILQNLQSKSASKYVIDADKIKICIENNLNKDKIQFISENNPHLAQNNINNLVNILKLCPLYKHVFITSNNSLQFTNKYRNLVDKLTQIPVIIGDILVLIHHDFPLGEGNDGRIDDHKTNTSMIVKTFFNNDAFQKEQNNINYIFEQINKIQDESKKKRYYEIIKKHTLLENNSITSPNKINFKKCVGGDLDKLFYYDYGFHDLQKYIEDNKFNKNLNLYDFLKIE